MAKVYFRNIISGAMKFTDVKDRWKPGVRELLIAAGRADLIEASE